MQAQNRPLMAAGLILLAMAIFGFIDNFVRLIAADAGLAQFHLVRSVLALALMAVGASVLGWRLRPKRPVWVLARSALASLAMILYFACLGVLPIAEAVAGLFTAPIWIVVFSVVLLRQRVGVFRISAVALGFAGTVLALGLGPANLTLLSLAPVAAGAVYALSNIATRQWCSGESTLTLLAVFFAFFLVWGAAGLVLLNWLDLPVAPGRDGFVLRQWVAPSVPFLVWTLVQAAGSLVGVGLVIKAYQIADSSYVAVFEPTNLVFATGCAALMWNEWPDGRTLAGLGLILVSGIVIAVRAPQTAPRRAPVDVEEAEAGGQIEARAP